MIWLTTDGVTWRRRAAALIDPEATVSAITASYFRSVIYKSGFKIIVVCGV
jgi:hypothetical protein